MTKTPKRRQRNIKYSDPSVTPLGMPKPLPVGTAQIAKLTRQLRRTHARTARART